jgi:hypothetical protein
MTTLQFTLPSNPGCAPLVCGVDNDVMVPLKLASAAKSADGSGYLRGTITTTVALSLTEWRYTVEIEDSEIADGETVTADDVTGTLCCISCSDAAILAKLNAIAPADPVTPYNWQTFRLYQPGEGVVTADAYLFRRATGFRLHEWQIGIVSGTGTTSGRLYKTAANGTSYSALTASLSIVSPTLCARRAYSTPLVVNAFEAVRIAIAGAVDIYSAAHYGLELHLLTSDL